MTGTEPSGAVHFCAVVTTPSSPLFAEGRVYVFSEEGKVGVLKAGREFSLLAENQFDAGFMASPAVSGKALYLRTKTSLYRVEE